MSGGTCRQKSRPRRLDVQESGRSVQRDLLAVLVGGQGHGLELVGETVADVHEKSKEPTRKPFSPPASNGRTLHFNSFELLALLAQKVCAILIANL